jgi:hypothetical protein
MSATPQLCLVAPAVERWLTAEEALADSGWSTFWLREKAKHGEIISRESDEKAANGRPKKLYLADSFPAEIRAKFPREQNSASIQGPLFAGVALVPSNALRITLPDPEAQKQAEERLEILKPALEFSSDPGRFSAFHLGDGRAVSSQTSLIQYVAQARGISERTIKLWLQRYRQGGFPALADKQRCDKHSSRFFAHYHNAAILAAYLYLECRQNARVVYEAIVQDRELLAIPELELPSYETVRAFLKLMPPYLKTYALEGRRAYQERMAPYIRRGYDDVGANQCWISDHMIHDVEVMNDCFPEAEWGAPIRLRFTCLLDFRARYVVGTSWCWEGSSRSIATAMRHAVLQHGPCDHFYCDNGKDYKRVAKGAMPAYLDESPLARASWYRDEMRWMDEVGIIALLQMKVSYCIVRHPQSKHVERFFRTLHEQFDKRWYQHYTGGAPHLRPDATSAEMEIHRKLMRHDRVDESNHPRASAFIAACMAWIEEYHQRPHSGEGMDGRCPAEVFAQERNPQQRPSPHPFELALLLAEHVRRRVRECAVELTIAPGHARRYTYTDAVSRDILHECNDTDVLVAYDPNDAEGVAILDQGGHFLCWARAEEFLRFAPEDAETQRKIGESMADRRHMEKATRNLISGISQAARSIGARTPVEMLAERAKMAPVIDPVLTHRALKLSPDNPSARPTTPAEAARLFLQRQK